MSKTEYTPEVEEALEKSITPTPEQIAIERAARETNDSLMINAYAGTGKTTTLVMLTEVLPKIPSVALAFNVKIKKELESRFPSNYTVLTLNGLGHRAWTQAVGRCTLDERKHGKIITQIAKSYSSDLSQEIWDDARRLMSAAMQRGLIPNFFPQKGLIMDTPAVWVDIALDIDASKDAIQLAREALIESIKQGAGVEGREMVITYDDQLYLPTFFGGKFNTYPLLMVDEAQDLSPIQHKMIEKTCPKGRIIAVGDPKQAIYQFRGADSFSMKNLRKLRSNWIDLPLTLTFRCPRVHVARQQNHAPGYTAAPSNIEGRIIDLTNSPEGWTWQTLVESLGGVGGGESMAVLCRNNAPLISLAFKLLSRNIGVVMLGRDIGKGLVNLAKKILPEKNLLPEACAILIKDWEETEASLAKVNEKEHKISGIKDRAECLMAVLTHAKNAGDLITKLSELFSRDRGQIILASGHRSKGLEWEHVLHLDPFLIPSKYAIKMKEKGDFTQLEQEYNLRYVIETRAKKTLVLAKLNDFERN